MDKRVEKILEMWHNYFEVENVDRQYIEFEPSDIEYFVGCMLYNHFAFSKALSTMKTIDLSYDFLSACSDEYDEVVKIIESINFDDELDKLAYLQKYMAYAREKYSDDELYLLNRLQKHINSLQERYEKDIKEIPKVEFKAPIPKNRNPLLR